MPTSSVPLPTDFASCPIPILNSLKNLAFGDDPLAPHTHLPILELELDVGISRAQNRGCSPRRAAIAPIVS